MARMDRRLFLLISAGLVAAPWNAVWAKPVPPSLRRVSLINAHTGETFSGTYRNEAGPIAPVMEELSVFLRDHHSSETTGIDVGLMDFLANVMDSVGAARATILSAYRTPETNAMLARTNFGVAERSQHIYGRALDIRLSTRLEDAMGAARAMKGGGVGWYPNSGFVHIDTGPVRNWTLDGRGFDKLLLELRRLIDEGGLAISPKGELVTRQTGDKLTVRQRLAMHRLIAKAEAAASGH